jgi:hypothetical protein
MTRRLLALLLCGLALGLVTWATGAQLDYPVLVSIGWSSGR